MTADRDALAELIRERCWPSWKYPETPESIADAILAAGWRAPLPNRWTCGHERRPGNWGINGECIRCAMVGQQISATIEAMET